MAGNLTNMIASIFSGSAVTADPYYEYTTLLLPGSGTNGAQNNTFLDGSTNNFTITRNGNTTQGTFSPFSQTGWGNYFNGTNAYLTFATNAAFNLGTADFTIEWNFYYSETPPAGSGYDYLFGMGANATTGIALYIQGGVPKVWNGSLVLTSSQSVVGFTWYHLALVRSSGTLTMYLNGTSVGSVSLTSNLTGGELSSGPSVGTWSPVDLSYFPGYISNLRIVKGTAIVPPSGGPTSPLTAVSGTSLLTCQSNRFRDASSNNFAATINGSPSVQAFSPFNPTASWSAATNGGSGYFDGNGDALSISSQVALGFGTGDFCTEFWAYRQNQVNYQVIFQLNTYNNGLYIRAEAPQYSDSFYFVGVSYNWDPATNFKLNSWTHFCITRQSGTLRFLTNGKLIVNATNTNNMGAATADIGAAGYLGYLSGVRIVKGSVPSEYQTSITTVGTQVFNPPTAPPTNVTDTQLLLNFTNAGIYDATSKNDLETVGNAQISNTTAQFGSTSIKFDGTGDSLDFPTSTFFTMGTGDFTIECWYYSPVGYATGNAYLFDLGVNGTRVQLASNQLYFIAVAGSGVTGAAGIGTGASTWYHLAIARSGSTITVYVNGTSIGNVTNASNLTDNDCRIGQYGGGGNGFNGYIQDFRITKGYARYTANFTAPTAAFPTL
jgi:hypothetical protein